MIYMPRKKNKKSKSEKLIHLYTQITSLIIGCLIFVIFLGIAGGIVKTLMDFKLLLKESVELGVRQILINVLILFALIEVLRTALSYLSEKRVRVTFIIDTVLIVMLNEIMSFWYKGGSINAFIILMISIGVLIAARIIAIRYSPDIHE